MLTAAASGFRNGRRRNRGPSQIRNRPVSTDTAPFWFAQGRFRQPDSVTDRGPRRALAGYLPKETHNQVPSVPPIIASPSPVNFLRLESASTNIDSPPAADTVLRIVKRTTSIIVN